MRPKLIRKCRLCGNKELGKRYSLGSFAINDFPSEPTKNPPKCPLTLVKCQSCELWQLLHTVAPEILYKKGYWYKSGINKIIRDDLKDIVKQTLKLVKIKKGDVWCDVGANDGTLLSYVPKKMNRAGVEPAENLQEELKKNCDVVIDTTWECLIFSHKCKVISAIGMFYDSDDPNEFVALVKKHLTDDGVFVAQLMTLAPMYKKNDFSNICHEHLEYYSYKNLVYLFEKAGLEIFKVEENDINGGSYRLFARHYQKGSVKHREPKFDIEKFMDRIFWNRLKTNNFINKVVFDEGKKVYAYGASTKGNTILQNNYLEPDRIAGVADKNPEKWGKYTVGTNIPIVSEEEARKNADYFLILPHAFTDFFIEREKKWRKKGGKFITIIPKFKIL